MAFYKHFCVCNSQFFPRQTILYQAIRSTRACWDRHSGFITHPPFFEADYFLLLSFHTIK